MDDEFAGKFIKAIYQYHLTNEIPEMDFALEMATASFFTQFERDNEKYLLKCAKNKFNGRKGGRPKSTDNQESTEKEEKPKETQKTQSVILKPKKADSDNDSDSDNDNDSDSDNDSDNNINIKVKAKRKTKPLSKTTFSPKSYLLEHKVSEEVAVSWLAYRRRFKRSTSKLVINSYLKAVKTAEISLEEGLILQEVKGWHGLEAEWIINTKKEKSFEKKEVGQFYKQNDYKEKW